MSFNGNCTRWNSAFASSKLTTIDCQLTSISIILFDNILQRTTIDCRSRFCGRISALFQNDRRSFRNVGVIHNNRSIAILTVYIDPPLITRCG